MNKREKFIKNLKNILKENNLTQKQLADMIGCSKTTISKWFLMQTQPTFDNIVKLIEALNCSFEELIS